MAVAGAILARCHQMLRKSARPGVTTMQLDEIAERFIRSQDATPAFKGYRGFPGSICASPNSMVVHGIPGAHELKRGDLLSVDIGVIKDGWVADAAQTYGIGPIGEPAEKLLEVTRRFTVRRNRRGEGGKPPRRHLARDPEAGRGRWPARDQEPRRPRDRNRDARGSRRSPTTVSPAPARVLEEGVTLAIEPMVNVGTDEIRMGSDHWAVYSADGSLAAHFEFTVAVGADGPRILTPWHEQ